MKKTALLPSRRHALKGLALALAFVGIATQDAEAGEGAPTLALSKEEIKEIVIEARRRARHEDPPGSPWVSLDPNKLTQLLKMQEFVQLKDSEKAPLIDQAGAWELMPFDKPSDAQVMWARWYPDRGIDKQVGPEDRTVYAPQVFYADQYWGKEAGAMIALMRCMPSPVWYVRDQEPMLWTMQRHTSWDQPNVFNFGECVRKQSEEGRPPGPHSSNTRRGMDSAEILERKISSYLLNHRCSGKGPDSCLPLLHALQSLNPAHKQFTEILRALEPELGLGETISIPEALQQRRGNLEPAEFEQIQTVRREAVRRAIFLTAKLPVLFQAPQEWPAGELETTIRRMLSLSLLLLQTSAIQAVLDDGLDLDRREFSNVWGRLPKNENMPAALSSIMAKLGREYAASSGCNAAVLSLQEPPRTFWIAYSLHKLRQEGTSCGVLVSRLDLAKLYAQTAEKKTGQPGQMDEFRQFVNKAGPARDEVMRALGPACKTIATKRSDPWGVCRLQIRGKKIATASQ